jgi:hypothetical protein
VADDLKLLPGRIPDVADLLKRPKYLRECSLDVAFERVVEALRQFGFARSPELDHLFARASEIPEELAGIFGPVCESELWESSGWTCFLQISAENFGPGTRRQQWCLDFRIYQKDFRLHTDP